MNSLFKAIILLILWYTGLLGQILIVLGGILVWAGAILTPNAFYFGAF